MVRCECCPVVAPVKSLRHFIVGAATWHPQHKRVCASCYGRLRTYAARAETHAAGPVPSPLLPAPTDRQLEYLRAAIQDVVKPIPFTLPVPVPPRGEYILLPDYTLTLARPVDDAG